MASSMPIPKKCPAEPFKSLSPPNAPTDSKDLPLPLYPDISFYLKLLLLSVVTPYTGTHTEREDASNSPTKLRQEFLDKFAYLCDVEKGGATVTAAAIRKTQKQVSSNELWLAANEGIRPEVHDFAKRTLALLKTTSEINRALVEEVILRDAIETGIKRIEFYCKMMIAFEKICRNKVQISRQDSDCK